MNCYHIQEQLSSYVDHELSQSERDSVERHLKSCTQCQKVFYDLQEVASIIKTEFGHVVAPHDIDERILFRIEKNIQKNSQIRHLSILYLVCALLCSGCIMAIIISPVGMFIRTFLTLILTLLRGVVYISASIGHPGLTVLVIFCTLLAGLSLVGVIRMLRSTQSEALL